MEYAVCRCGLSMVLLRRAVVSIFLLSFVFCDLRAAGQSKGSTIIHTNREIGISFEPSQIAYREFNTDGTVQDSEHGWISGVEVKASLLRDTRKISNLLSDASYDFNEGSSKHWSEPQTGTGILQYSAPFESNDVLFGIGKGCIANSKFFLAPEIEAEYREWLRKLAKAKYAVQENYTFWAPGVAVNAGYSPFRLWVMKARLGYQYEVAPTNATIGNPVNQTPNWIYSLGHRPVWQADLGLDWDANGSMHVTAGIDYSHFGFGRSPVKPDNTVEPNSVTDLAKVNAGLAWSF